MAETQRFNNTPDMNTNSYTSTASSSNIDNVIVSTSVTEFSKGPLPHPELLKGYDSLIKDGAERIMQMAEAEQRNRFAKDKADIECEKNEISLIKRGQTMAFCLCLLFVGAGIAVAFLDMHFIAYCLLAVGMAPVIGVFYNSSSIKRK
ncbi:MAG: DUF2335 domain-containing protein [Muribaculum sp.]|nr:DUF2335 domain-containing protein [Muribaculum sp.]